MRGGNTMTNVNSSYLTYLLDEDDVELNTIRRHTPMAKPSSKCALELSQEISTDVISDWSRLIHSGWAHPLNYLHGGCICAPRECYAELRFLWILGTAIHEEAAQEGYSK